MKYANKLHFAEGNYLYSILPCTHQMVSYEQVVLNFLLPL